MADSKRPQRRAQSSRGTGGKPSRQGADDGGGAGGGGGGEKISQADQEKLRRLIRQNAQQYLRLPNVTSVGIGYRVKGGKQTKELAAQFTVARKLTPESLAAAGHVALLKQITGPDGTTLPVDVIERSYKPSHTLIADADAEAEANQTEAEARAERQADRRRRLDTVLPGVSI